MDQQPATGPPSKIGRDGRYKANVNELDQFDQSRHEHDDRDVWRPRKSQGGYRQETQPQHVADGGGFRDRGMYGGSGQQRPDRRDRDYHRQNPGQYNGRSQDYRDRRPRFQEGNKHAYGTHSGRRRSRERSPHRQEHPRTNRGEPRQAHGAAPQDAHEGRHTVAAEGSGLQQQQHHSSRGPGGPASRMSEGRHDRQGSAQAAGQAAAHVNSTQQQPDRPFGGRNSWGQQGSRRPPDPFAGGGKWKHDGFEELEKQQTEGTVGPADSKSGAVVAAPS